MKVYAPLILASKSAKSSLSLIPAPSSASLSSAVNEVPPISLVSDSPSRGVGRSSFSLLPKFSTGPTLYPPFLYSSLKSSSYSLACAYLSPPLAYDFFFLCCFLPFFCFCFLFFFTFLVFFYVNFTGSYLVYSSV